MTKINIVYAQTFFTLDCFPLLSAASSGHVSVWSIRSARATHQRVYFHYC